MNRFSLPSTQAAACSDKHVCLLQLLAPVPLLNESRSTYQSNQLQSLLTHVDGLINLIPCQLNFMDGLLMFFPVFIFMKVLAFDKLLTRILLEKVNKPI